MLVGSENDGGLHDVRRVWEFLCAASLLCFCNFIILCAGIHAEAILM